MAQFLETPGADGTCTVSLVGDLDIAGTSAFVQRVRACWGHADEVVLDFAQLSFIDSSGLGALVLLRKEAAQQSKRLRLVEVGAATSQLLRMTGLQDSFDVSPPAP